MGSPSKDQTGHLPGNMWLFQRWENYGMELGAANPKVENSQTPNQRMSLNWKGKKDGARRE